MLWVRCLQERGTLSSDRHQKIRKTEKDQMGSKLTIQKGLKVRFWFKRHRGPYSLQKVLELMSSLS